MTRNPLRAPGALTGLAGLTLLALLSTGTSVPGQTVAEGYASRLTALPTGAAQTLVLDDGEVYFTGTELVLRRGTTQRRLLGFATAVFGSFTIRTGPGTLLFGESSNGGLWSVPLAQGTPRRLATLKFNFSATPYDSHRAIVSAKTGGLSSKDNELVAVDLRTGALDVIAVLPGASGPVGSDGHGNLYYVTASNVFPAPRGQARVLRFAAHQVQGALGPGQLGIGAAAVVFRGLDAASSIALDDDQDLFLVDWMNREVLELSEVQTARPRRSVLLAYPPSAPVSAAAVQFVPGDRWGYGLQQLEPFQPAGGGRLIVHESAFNSTSQLRAVTAARATLGVSTANPVPRARRFDLVVRGGHRGGTAFVALGPGGHGHELAFHLGHSEAPVFWAARLLAPLLLAPVPLDSTGTARLGLFNPGFTTPLTLTAQAYFDAPGSAGTTAPLALELR